MVKWTACGLYCGHAVSLVSLCNWNRNTILNFVHKSNSVFPISSPNGASRLKGDNYSNPLLLVKSYLQLLVPLGLFVLVFALSLSLSLSLSPPPPPPPQPHPNPLCFVKNCEPNFHYCTTGLVICATVFL